MKKILQIILIFFVISCADRYKENTDLFDLIPTEPILILKFNSQKEFNSGNFNKILNSSLKIESEVINYELINGTVLRSFHNLGKKEIHTILFSELKNINQKPIPIDSLKYNGFYIKRSKKNEKEYFHTVKNGFYIQSTSKLLVENCLRSSNFINTSKAKNLKKLYDISGNSLSLFISNNFSNYLNYENFKNIFDISEISDWIQFDIKFNNNKLILSGLGFQQDSIAKKFNFLKNIKPTKLGFEKVIPLNFKNFQKISYDHSDYILGLKQFSTVESVKKIINDSLYYDVNEMGKLLTLNDTLYLLRLKSNESFEKKINKILKSVFVYRNYNLYELNSGIFKSKNRFFDNDFSKQKFAVFVNNNLILSSNKKSIETFVLNYTNSSTLNKSVKFINSYENIPEKSNFLNIYNLENFDSDLFNVFQLDKKNYNYWINHSQIEDNLIYNNHSVIKSLPGSNNFGPKILFNVKLNDEVWLEPTWVTNYINKKKEIITQDKSNNLYLINGDGNVIWKKNIREKIIGKIFQVDLYKNGRLQYAFTTDKSFIILDKNGNEVKKVNHKKNASVVGLSVFDYDKIKNYRFLITYRDEIKMLNSKMKVVKGFNKKNVKSIITKAPKHFRVGSKDYLVINTEKKLYILDRRGKIRIDIPQNLNISQSEIFINDNIFMALEKNNLISIGLDGKISKKTLSLDSKYQLYANQNNIILLSENLISINGRDYKFNYGNYSKPKIFAENLISTTNKNENKLYVFDKEGSLISNFPIFGSGESDVTTDNNNKNLIVVRGDKNEILAYKID